MTTPYISQQQATVTAGLHHSVPGRELLSAGLTPHPSSYDRVANEKLIMKLAHEFVVVQRRRLRRRGRAQ